MFRVMVMVVVMTMIGLAPAGLAGGAVVGEPKRPFQDRPDDRPCEHVEVVRSSPHGYQIEFRGTVDGTMTRMPVGYAAFQQGWQPNRSVRIENVGPTDVHNPRLAVNGKRNWHSLQQIVEEAAGGYTAPAEKARAIWEYQRRTRFHACTWDAECNDVVKVLNVYGYTLCGNEAHLMNDLWKAAGFRTRRGYPVGHVVCEVFYDGAYHLLDSDEHVLCLKRDNRTIASCEDIVRDHDLVKRTHTYGIGRREERKSDEFSASLYSYEGQRKGDFGMNTQHTMDLVLRPGESIELRWDHIGKEYSAGSVPREGQRMRDGLGSLARWGPVAYDNLRNGKIRYRPDWNRTGAEGGAECSENLRWDAGRRAVRPEDPQRPGWITWRFASPYVFVGGRATATVQLGPKAWAEWRYSADGATWKTIATARSPEGTTLEAVLDQVVSPRGQPAYRFFLQLALGGPAEAHGVAFDHDIQTSLLSLPELVVGTNRIRYTDASRGDRQVRITHQWLERTAWHPPGPPAEAVRPPDGATVAGTRITFRWTPGRDPDGDRMVDYHFELSEYEDMRWPLSPSFEKLTSQTPSRGKPEWTVPYVGLLDPDTTYYWHVRARDSAGVWGPWSKTFRFRASAPGVPLHVRLEPDNAGGLTLRWEPNPQGEAPAEYKVYGSDERGFSASDTEYLVFQGKGFCRTLEEYENKPADSPDAGLVKTPANLITAVRDTRLRVVGEAVALENANKAFYRVVAVDSAGNESGPSDYTEVPRPYLWNRPPGEVSAGRPFRWEPKLVRSLGDLRCRRSPTSSYNAAFWDREEFTFAATELPPGLAQDPQTGVISGRPTATGTFPIAFAVSGPSGKRQEYSFPLAVLEPPS